MLAAIIEDKNNNTSSQLFINKTENAFSLNGFSVTNGVMSEFNKEYLKKVFAVFILSDSQEPVGIIDGYSAVLDKSSGIYHFFKNGKEDFNKSIIYNSKEFTLCDFNNNKLRSHSNFRKIILKSLGLIFVINMSFGNYVGTYVNGLINEDYSVEYNYGNYIQVEVNKLFDTISYSYQDVDNVLRGNITPDHIKNLIYSSVNLTDEEKNIIWNPALVNMVIPYYQGTNHEVIALVRHTNIGIESFSSEEEGKENWNGYYDHDHIIHLCDYISSDVGNRIGTIGHEYVHLLQVSTTPSFIAESSAELISREFFLNISDSNGSYSYREACKYLKVLMEIVGPDVIIESNFCLNSTALQDAVRNYFTDEEYEDFIHIMDLSPCHDSSELEESGYQRLHELLGVLYNNKYGKDIDDDIVISSILKGRSHNRVYFNDNLRNIERDYVCVPKTYTIEDAIKESLVKVRVRFKVTREEYDMYEGLKLWSCYSKDNNRVVVVSCGPPIEIRASIDDRFTNIYELIQSGDLDLNYLIETEVDVDEYTALQDLENVSEVFYDLEEGYVLTDDKTTIVKQNDYDKIYIDSILEKNNNALIQV